MSRLFRRLGFAFLALLLLSLTSCGRSDRKAVYPVSGQVFFNDKAAEGARITLVALDDTEGNTPRPGAQVKKNGSFRLSTYASYDGAPAGRYAVMIVYPSPERKVDGENGGPDLPRGKYTDPKTTPLQVEIADGTNELEPFNLK